MASAQSTHCPRFKDQFRPDWTFWNMAIMILAFVTGLWPLGLFMIAYMIWGRQWGLDFSNWGRMEQSMSRAGDKMKHAFGDTFDGNAWSNRTDATGNAAFDEWRAEELRRLEEERRKLDEARREFESYMEELRRARDREEFERFKARWAEKNSAPEEDTPSAN